MVSQEGRESTFSHSAVVSPLFLLLLVLFFFLPFRSLCRLLPCACRTMTFNSSPPSCGLCLARQLLLASRPALIRSPVWRRQSSSLLTVRFSLGFYHQYVLPAESNNLSLDQCCDCSGDFSRTRFLLWLVL